MATLTKASRQLFTRPPDEQFESLNDLFHHCHDLKRRSSSVRHRSIECRPLAVDGHVSLQVRDHTPCRLTDWSFTQLCGLASASKDTLNRLVPKTAAQVLSELLDGRSTERSNLHALVQDSTHVRALNGDAYVRLWNADLVTMLEEFATDFVPPQKGFNGATGLYAGEQDMFVFLIDPTGWSEIGNEAFAPGVFIWNSEVGKRTVGVSTFWFQSVCANHIVWDAVDVTEVTRRHQGDVQSAFRDIRQTLETLIKKRDERKDGFAKVIAKAMRTVYGHDAEEVHNLLSQAGFSRTLAKRATELARQKGRLTIWSVVDALTQLNREHKFAGSRSEADAKAARLLALAAK